MNGTDIHLGHAIEAAELLPTSRHNAFLKFSGSFISKRKRDDVTRRESILEERHNTLSHNLGFARPRASDDLETLINRLNCFLLLFGESHLGRDLAVGFGV